MGASTVTLYWHRDDLRLGDNPALFEAAQRGAVQPVFIYDDTGTDWPLGGASQWWLHHSLVALQAAYRDHGVTLMLRRGDPRAIMPKLAADLRATHVAWNRRYTPHGIAQDTELKQRLTTQGLTVDSYNGHLLLEPWQLATKTKTPFKVFTPFWRALQAVSLQIALPLPVPDHVTGIQHTWPSDDLADWHFRPTRPNWAKSFEPEWTIGEAAAQTVLANFADDAVQRYLDDRDYPAIAGTSRLSPHLAFGEISPRQVWQYFRHAQRATKPGTASYDQIDGYLRQIGWRDFAYHLLYHFPQTPTAPLYPQFRNFPWLDNDTDWQAWTRGQTGYPLVDAAMRQLWQTGWMHNRLRMVAGSFLIKDLGLDWQRGARWFWDTLVDADLANNTMGWQWVAGCGADASPYYRIFNPITQSQKFDANGAFIRRFVPEIAGLPDKYIHAPWTAPGHVLQAANITLGKTYPAPIVDHDTARKRALGMLQIAKERNA